MVERSLSMREVPGSIPGFSTSFFLFLLLQSLTLDYKNVPNDYFYLFCTIRLMFLRATNWISGSADNRVTTEREKKRILI